jgi:hypothetical protein
LDYPNDFDIPSFSAGKTVAFSRSVSVWISIIFFLIIATCGLILLGKHLTKNYPFLISIDPYTDEWTVVAYPQEKKTNIQQYEVIQEKLVNDYITNWFALSDDDAVNELRWQECSVEECADAEQFKPDNLKCAISCKSGEKLFEDFSERVIPWYIDLIKENSETWSVDRILITRNRVFENFSRWQIIADIKSNVRGTFKVLGFVEIKRDVNKYPATFGYYVEEFNAYRINNNE